MMNVFTISSQDQSVYYLGQIFGNIGGVLPVTNGPLAVGLMFKVLNTAALSVGALIVVYTTVAGLLSTASEGEFLGKKWSGLWVPVRTVLGIVGLFPSSGGYCAIQVIIMWLILKGVGLADTLWASVLTMMEKNGDSPYVTVPFPNISGVVKQPMQDLFKGLVCYESLAFVPDAKDKTQFYNYACLAEPTNARCGAPLPSYSPASDASYSLGECGELTVCNKTTICNANPDGIKCLLCQAQHQALPAIIATFDTVAKQIVQFDYQYQKFYYNSNKLTINDAPQWVQDFCTADKNIGSKCCVNSVPQTTDASLYGSMPDLASLAPDNTTCSSTIFTSKYPPFIQGQGVSDKPDDSGSVTDEVVSDIFNKFAIQPYVDKVDIISAAMDQYLGVLMGAYTNHTALGIGSKLTGWREESKNNGWILAGMYYYQMTKGAVTQLTVSMQDLPQLGYDNLPTPGVGGSPSTIINVRNNLSAMTKLLSLISQAGQTNSFVRSSSPALQAVSSTSDMSNMTSSFMSDVTGLNEHTVMGQGGRVIGAQATNPLYRISIYGYNLIWTTQLLFWITVLISALAAGLTSVNFMGFGSGFTTSPIYEGFKTAAGFVTPFWMLGLSALFSIGVTLGVYVPFIPFTIYTMGVIGWLMATIEAMVAGPIIALGILSPSGQHEILGKSEPAVMIIFNLILRPCLMVFGLVTSLYLSVVAVTLLNQSFLKVARDIITHPALVENILMMMMYTLIIITVLNKVFTLIYVIPEKVLTYIGGQAISYGEGEGLAGIKQAMEGGASGISGAGKEAGGGVGAGIQKVKEGVEHDKSAEVKAAKEAAAAKKGKKPDDKGSGPSGPSIPGVGN